MESEQIYRLALARIPGIGPVYAKRLIAHFGEASAIFRTSPRKLEQVQGLGSGRAKLINEYNDFTLLEKEIIFLEQHQIRCLFLTDPDYPQRLLQCKNAPILLFYKGQADLNASRIISVIGTRKPTEYGQQAVDNLLAGLSPYRPIIISGLAFGIDAAAHRSALKNKLPTIGVLAHGLDRIYPTQHRNLAVSMLEQGGVLTGFPIDTEPDTFNFPLRNRIIAGICDALVVAETGETGGSMLTIANALENHTKIFAIPGRLTDKKSTGCNQLIRNGQAQLLTDANQLAEHLQWQPSAAAPSVRQRDLFSTDDDQLLSPQLASVYRCVQQAGKLSLDQLSVQSHLSASDLALPLLQLELQGLIRSLPGHQYMLAS